jgi:hypothetical protein
VIDYGEGGSRHRALLRNVLYIESQYGVCRCPFQAMVGDFTSTTKPVRPLMSSHGADKVEGKPSLMMGGNMFKCVYYVHS